MLLENGMGIGGDRRLMILMNVILGMGREVGGGAEGHCSLTWLCYL